MRVCISGGVGGTNVGDSLHHSCKLLDIDSTIIDTKLSSEGNRLWRAICWRVLGHRPASYNKYQRILQRHLDESKPDILITTGVSPVSADTLEFAKKIKVTCANFSTDDPWNKSHIDKRYLKSIPYYDAIFTPRRVNITDFNKSGAKRVEYLPFAYDPRFIKTENIDNDKKIDVLFVGGGDRDRIAMLLPICRSEFNVVIHGNYWGNDPSITKSLRGQVGYQELCKATLKAKINLCLVRRANRDEHVMRSYEIPAIGGFVLAEDTIDHRELYGDSACYFKTAEDIVVQVRKILNNEHMRSTMSEQCQKKIISENNTYTDRLKTILNFFPTK
jgi:spore maturation protein CgeB